MKIEFTVYNENGEVVGKSTSWVIAERWFNYEFPNGWIENQRGTVVAGRKPICTIDITPTWTAILPVLIVALTDGNDKAKALAKEELQRMAQIADSASR